MASTALSDAVVEKLMALEKEKKIVAGTEGWRYCFIVPEEPE